MLKGVSRFLTMMQSSASDVCPANCSGHGDCIDGLCICQLEYQGTECGDFNSAYFIAFGLIFYMLSACCTIQLILCIQSDFHRLKNPSVYRALKVTTQKLLYFLVIIAALSRALYFSLKKYLPDTWADNMLSMYYPLLLSCLSLVVCFWAEAFHVSGKQHNNPGFLSKSYLFFLLFNILLYMLLFAEFVTMETSSLDYNLLRNIFNGCYAGLMTIEVFFFLVYGVEVFFKIKGAFTTIERSSSQSANPAHSPSSGNSIDRIDSESTSLSNDQSLDISVMHQSRIGMLFQGLLQIAMVLFLMFNVTEPQWKESLSIFKKNVHDVFFRIIEVGLALWFPCVLWRCRSPGSLWMLNPTRLFRQTRDEEKSQGIKKEEDWLLCRKRAPTYDSTSDRARVEKEVECWICYDPHRTDSGPMIQPCQCKGDVAYVHHDCLKRWLMESADNPEALHCTVCKSQYQLKTGSMCFLRGFQLKHGLFTATSICLMAASPALVYLVIQRNPSNAASIISIGACILLEMIFLKYLGISCCNAYNRAKISSFRIMGSLVNNGPVTMATVSMDSSIPSQPLPVTSSESATMTMEPKMEPSVSVVSVSVISTETTDGIMIHSNTI
ncbi:uncharacterized protein LOC117303515 [Asterias rubens]|uniref:uncharacterized protein LOC117303515 n=1 Tax=Asterias rubens TaxID=7604 RepID=UPI001454FEF8|nr:uncharacterized protein LOC117303515 [Asterias rubens]XP_033643630.1 uncharacterized protein LOC117303515 [Asterias rubens]XP_033643631.1 uncharacterized protein LOC117303515 [Asterias rubens]